MASNAAASSIVCVSFNQDNSAFAIATREGFRLFEARTGKLVCEKLIGGLSIVEMLHNTNIVLIVGAGEQPSLSPRRLSVHNVHTGDAYKELNFLTSILAVRLNKQRTVVVLQDKTYIYNSHTLALLHTIDTVPNTKGLCAFCPYSEGYYLALPASKTKGSVLIYNTLVLYSLCQVDAHVNPLSAIAFSYTGMYIATASEHGTIIRVHLVSQATKSYSFRRGTYPSTIYSLSFGPSPEFPDILVAMSSSGSIHVFSLVSLINQRSRKSDGLLGFLIPDSVNSVLESGHHHILHDAVPAGVKSYAMVHSVEKGAPTDGVTEITAFSACICIVDQNACFREYSFSTSKTNEPSWKLEQEHNLLVFGTEGAL